MGRSATIFIAICMCVIALSAAAVLVFQFDRPFGEAVSLSLALMCTMIMFHLLLGRARDRSDVSEAVDRLEDRMVEIDEDVGNLEGRLTGVERTIPRKFREEIDPLFAEVEVLGSLVKQMAEAMTDLETRVEDQQKLSSPYKAPGIPHHSASHLPFGVDPARFETRQIAPERADYTYSEQGAAASAQAHLSSYEPETAPHRREEMPVAPAPRYSSAAMDRSGAEVGFGLDDGEDVHAEGEDDRHDEEVAPNIVERRPDPAMRELINSALNANRVELHLQPIVTLPQRQVKYYEAYSRLRDAQGNLILPSAFLPEAVQSGLVARIDNLLLFRSIQVVRRLTSRNRDTALFCNISMVSLIDETFFPGFLEFAKSNSNIADVLIFEFSQEDVAQMGVMEIESLNALAEIGFQFSVDRITDMKMDFKAIAQRGFKYAKLQADYLIGRRKANHGHIHPSDFGDLLHRYGMELITDHVETESQVLELLDYDVKLAQGNLFSPPRPVRSEVFQGTPAPAARKRAAG